MSVTLPVANSKNFTLETIGNIECIPIDEVDSFLGERPVVPAFSIRLVKDESFVATLERYPPKTPGISNLEM